MLSRSCSAFHLCASVLSFPLTTVDLRVFFPKSWSALLGELLYSRIIHAPPVCIHPLHTCIIEPPTFLPTWRCYFPRWPFDYLLLYVLRLTLRLVDPSWSSPHSRRRSPDLACYDTLRYFLDFGYPDGFVRKYNDNFGSLY